MVFYLGVNNGLRGHGFITLKFWQDVNRNAFNTELPVPHFHTPIIKPSVRYFGYAILLPRSF